MEVGLVDNGQGKCHPLFRTENDLNVRKLVHTPGGQRVVKPSIWAAPAVAKGE